eukprot:32839_6
MSRLTSAASALLLGALVLAISVSSVISAPIHPNSGDWTAVTDAINRSSFRNITLIVASESAASVGRLDYLYSKG